MVECHGVIDALAAHIDWTCFGNVADTVRLDKWKRALRLDSSFWTEFEFVLWFCVWLGGLLRWIGTCPCNHDKGVVCWWRGRWLHKAYNKALEVLREGLDEAAQWPMHRFRDNQVVWQQGVAAVRQVYALGREGVAYLKTLPYVLARLEEPGIAQEAIDLYAAAPAHLHHPLSNEFLEPGHGSGLRPMVEAIDDAGGNVAPALRDAIYARKAVPMDDVVDESPHARAKHIIEKAPAGQFKWTASSVRLTSNLEDMETLAPSMGVDIQTEWDRWSSVVKLKNTERRKRMRRKEVGRSI